LEQKTLGLYLHFPFCFRKCFYCDFPSYADKEHLFSSYAAALRREITARSGGFASFTVDTVYFGGGTPTLLPTEELLQIIAAIKENFQIAQNAEWTVEANPGKADEKKLAALWQNGVNRISFGVQTFNDTLLKRIGRIHTASQARKSVQEALLQGFRTSLDLMYALPGETLQDAAADLDEAIRLGVKHISVYGLSIEAGTAFAKLREAGKLELPSEETEEAMYDAWIDGLCTWGFSRYEISNFAREGERSRHNLKYWRDMPYLGLGAAASSYVGDVRWRNIDRVEAYIEAIEKTGAATAAEERLTLPMQMEEFCFLALRTADGIDKASFAQKFHRPLAKVYGDVIKSLRAQSLLEESAANVYLTRRGMKFGNRVFAAFLLK